MALYAPTAALLGFLIWQRTRYRELASKKLGDRCLVVRQKGNIRQLVHRSLEGGTVTIQTTLRTDGSLRSTFPGGMYHSYFDVMHLASLFSATPPKKLLFLGAGGGGLPLQETANIKLAMSSAPRAWRC